MCFLRKSKIDNLIMCLDFTILQKMNQKKEKRNLDLELTLQLKGKPNPH